MRQSLALIACTLLLLCSFSFPFRHGAGSGEKYVLHQLRFEPTWEGVALEIGKTYPIVAIGDSMAINTLRFYISHVRLLDRGREVFDFPQQHFLVNMEDPASLSLRWECPESMAYDQIAFELGVDSLVQSAGAQGAALDPANGMYWSWQSGYIHVKLEGWASSSRARDKSFQYHLGGFQAPYTAITTVVLPIAKTGETRVRIALEDFFSALSPADRPEIMRPCAEAVQAIRIFADTFKTQL